MAQLNGNSNYINWDGVDISAYFADEISNEMSADTEDITSGSGATHIMRASKLIDGTLDLYVIYDDTVLDTYKALLQPGKKAVLVWGPEGNVSGKPRFEGSMILTSVGVAQSIEKTKVGFTLSFEQAAKPVSTLTGDLAGTFS